MAWGVGWGGGSTPPSSAPDPKVSTGASHPSQQVRVTSESEIRVTSETLSLDMPRSNSKSMDARAVEVVLSNCLFLLVGYLVFLVAACLLDGLAGRLVWHESLVDSLKPMQPLILEATLCTDELSWET